MPITTTFKSKAKKIVTLTPNIAEVIYCLMVMPAIIKIKRRIKATNVRTDTVMNVVVASGLNAAFIVALFGCDRHYSSGNVRLTTFLYTSNFYVSFQKKIGIIDWAVLNKISQT